MFSPTFVDRYVRASVCVFFCLTAFSARQQPYITMMASVYLTEVFFRMELDYNLLVSEYLAAHVESVHVE